MRVLHITDLHITDSTTSLNDLWYGLLPAIEPSEKLDFVIVSGDLVQAANAQRSYGAVKQFLKTQLLPCLKSASAERIVIVPGNHDVDWSKAPGDAVDLATLTPADLRCIEDYVRDPAGYIEGQDQPQWRMKLGTKGIEQLYRVDRDAYSQRFQAFQAFLEDFYGPKTSEQFRMFDLVSTNDGEHWSVAGKPETRSRFT